MEKLDYAQFNCAYIFTEQEVHHCDGVVADYIVNKSWNLTNNTIFSQDTLGLFKQ